MTGSRFRKTIDQSAYAAHIVGSMSTVIWFGPVSNTVFRVTLFRTTATEKFPAVAERTACVTKVTPRESGLGNDTTSVLEGFTRTTWSGSENSDAATIGVIASSKATATPIANPAVRTERVMEDFAIRNR